MNATDRRAVTFLLVASLAFTATGFTLFGILLEIHLLAFATTTMALAGTVAALGFGLVFSRALADPASPRFDEMEGPDRRLQMRALGLGISFMVAAAVTASHLEFRRPDADVASVFYGLALGSAIVFAILLVRRIWPPQPAPPLEVTIEWIFGDALEPAHAEVLREQVEAGDLDVERLSNASYDEIARILAVRGHALTPEKASWEEKIDRHRRERQHRAQAFRKPDGRPPTQPGRSAGRQQRGAR